MKERIKYKFPRNVDIELAEMLISIIGEEKIEEIYGLVKDKKISVAALNKILLLKRIKRTLKENPKKKITQIAKENRVCLNTVYKFLRKPIKIK